MFHAERFMTRTFILIALLLGGIGLLAIACSAQSNPGGTEGVENTGGMEDAVRPEIDAGADEPADDAPTPVPQALLRVAQLSPDLPPVDVCVAPHGTTLFQGPLLEQLVASLGEDGGTDAAPPGLAYAQVSAYLSLDEGQYDVRLVAAGATSCSPSLPSSSTSGDGAADAEAADGPDTDAASGGTPDWTDLPSLAFNTNTTLLIAGDWQPAGSDPGLTVALLGDDAVLVGPDAVLRAINAVPTWATADFGLGSFGSDWMAILSAVPFAAASADASVDSGGVDSNGYLAIAPQQGEALGARPSSSDGGAAVAVATSVEIDFGSIATVIAIGGKTGDTAHPPALLLCTDNQPSGALLSDCSVLP
jgi:hypothetical protein